MTNGMQRAHRLFHASVFTLGVLGVGTSAWAQRDRLMEDWDETRPVMPTPMEEMRDWERALDEGDRTWRGGVLREGAHVLTVPASVRHDEQIGSWLATLRLESTSGEMHEREVRLLPNSFLAELKQIIESAPEQNITFEMTGEVFVYERRNYLLLRSPARVVGLSRTEGEAHIADKPSVTDTDKADDADAVPDEAVYPDEDDDQQTPPRSAADVMRELERRSGPMHRAREPLRARDGEDARGRQEDAAQRLREGELLVLRKGRLRRDVSGAWMFVFDADATGLSDPPLTLMPCLLLERIERYARQAGPTAAILISGQVSVFEGRGYLLPSAFQLPRGKSVE